MSFLDEPDEPASRPRRRPAGGPSTDRQTLLARRTIAIGAGLLLLVLAVFGIRGCLDARKERAIEDYTDSAASIADESTQQGETLFDLLQGSGGQDQAVDAQNTANGLRVQSDQLVERARDLDVPDDVKTAQRYLLETLELRSDGLAKVADDLPNALGDESRRQGSEGVAAQMQVFLASDVIYAGRFRPTLAKVLRDEELAGPRVPASVFVPDIKWVDPDEVASAIDGLRTGGAATDETTGGLHGNGLVATSLGGVALTPGGSATVQLASDLAFDVQVANQGDSTETDVGVEVTVGEGDDAIELSETLPTIAAGETKSVSVPFGEQPPTGQNVAIEVTIRPVRGEEKTDNNSATYSVIFTR